MKRIHVEKYYIQVRWYNTKPYKGTWKYHSAFRKGKPVMGWTVSHASFDTEKEMIVFIKKELKKGHTLFQPPWYEKWDIVDGHFDILNYEREYIKNYKEKYNIAV